MRTKMLLLAAITLTPSTAHADFKADSPGAKPEQQIRVYRLAECVVARDTVGAERLLATLPGSKENAAANRKLVSAIDVCWRSQSSDNMLVGGSLIRGSIAEVLYHRALANSGGQPASPYATSAKDKK